MSGMPDRTPARPFRSRDWFADPARSDMTALYLERFMNYGITPQELQAGRPIIGIAQTGSDLSPCNRIHLELAKRVRDGIRDAGGIPMEFPVHPIFENCRRPTAALDRNLAYLGLVETLYGYPIDAVVLTTGCDKTTPSGIMAAATVDIPAIVLSGGPMLDGWFEGELVGSGTIIWKSRRRLAAGLIDETEFFEVAMASAPSAGHCNTMGTASTMNAVAEALGMSLPGCAAIPAPYRERAQMAYVTGRRIVEMAYEDLRPSQILTRDACENAIAVTCVIGGSSNSQPHIVALARHAGIRIEPGDWMRAYDIPLLVNVQPAGKYLPTLGDGRQSGTSDSPSILNASPKSAAGSGLAWLATGDTIRVDLNRGRCDALVDDAEIARRRGAAPPPVPASQTPWEELYRENPSNSATARCSSSPSSIAARRRRRRAIITSGAMLKTRRVAVALLFAAASRIAGAEAPGEFARFDWFEYRGADPIDPIATADARHDRNPILAGFYPDPSIERVGGDYYLVNSSFAYFPGIPLFHSRDLVTWTQSGNVIDRPGQFAFGAIGLSRGIFAPDITYHRGVFYLVSTCIDCGGNFVLTATDPAGPWSDPVWVDIDGIDPALFFDDDGSAWILNNGPPVGTPLYDGHRAIWIQRFDERALQPVGPRTLLVNGGVDLAARPIWAEGPHLFRKDGWYYLITVEGGTAEQHAEVVYRSRDVTGPYRRGPGTPILTQRELGPARPQPITSAGHADFLTPPAGAWWSVSLGARPYRDNYYSIRRETFLSPVKWTHGWPTITRPG